jgi:two-component system, OmpR family, sensor histidine kinase CiaH
MMVKLYKQFAASGTKWQSDLLVSARIKLTAVFWSCTAALVVAASWLLYQALLGGIVEVITDHVRDVQVQQVLYIRATTTLFHNILIADAAVLVFLLAAVYILTGLVLRPIRDARERERRFFADAAHELRTPLTVMKSGIEVVERSERGMSPRLAKLLTDTRTEIDELTHMANGLLALVGVSAPSRHAHEANHESLDMREVVERVTVKLALYAATHAVEIVHASHPSHEVSARPMPVYVRGSREQLERACTNVIENAVKYSHAGGRVSVDVSANSAQVIVRVADTGVGIVASDIPKITEPFFRSDAARATTSGSGLGLSIVSGTMRTHGGSIHIASALGTGTMVTLTLPHV